MKRSDAPYRCSQEPHPGREFYGDGGCGECGYRPGRREWVAIFSIAAVTVLISALDIWAALR